MAPIKLSRFLSAHGPRNHSRLFLWKLLGMASLSFCLWLCVENTLPPLSSSALQIHGYGAIDTKAMQEVAAGKSVQRIREEKGVISADYGFVSFNNDPLQINFSLPAKDLALYRQDYGYTQTDLDAIMDWQKKSLAEAFTQAVQNRWDQEQLNTVSKGIQDDFRKKQQELFATRGFRLQKGNILIPDIPGIVQRNVRPLQDVARQFSQAAANNGYDSQETIAAALTMVQTALRYQNLPANQGGRVTGGMTPPLVTMMAGEGDCDAKTALLAAILRNWSQIRLIGVAIPNHYLLGVLQNPAKGQAFVDYEGMRYVLLEPAGPGWLPPGTIAESTMARLAAGEDLRLEAL